MGCKYLRFRISSKREKCLLRIETAAANDKREKSQVTRPSLPFERMKYAVLNLYYSGASRARRSPITIEIGNLSMPENLVITSAFFGQCTHTCKQISNITFSTCPNFCLGRKENNIPTCSPLILRRKMTG